MSSSNKLSTDDMQLLAAIDPIAEKGYNGVLLRKLLVPSGLSEKTLFRRFGSKRNLLETAFIYSLK